MIVVDDVRAIVRDLKQRLTSALLSHRIRVLNPTLNCHPTVIWNYPFARPDALELGQNVTVMANCEILVFPQTKHSSKEGRLVIGDGAVIATNANLRAAGGVIRIGKGSAIGQNTVIVAVNHKVQRGVPYLYGAWEETRSGVTIEDNVWVGANSTLMPGITIGTGSMIAAGSAVTRDVPPHEIWGGVPARHIKPVPEADGGES